MSDLLTAPRSELLKSVYEIIDENQILKIRITKLQEENQRLKENLEGREKPSKPLFVKPNIKKKKRVFPENWIYPLNKSFTLLRFVLIVVVLWVSPRWLYKRQVIDLPQTNFVVTKHVVCKRRCLRCRKRVFPKLNLKDAMVGNYRFRLNLFTTITILRERLRLLLRVLNSTLRPFINLIFLKEKLLRFFGFSLKTKI